MNYFYFDSSALVKRYAKEIGTELVENLCQKEGVAIFISDIALAELGAAFARKLREGEITEDEYTAMLGDFKDDYLYESNFSFKKKSLIKRNTKEFKKYQSVYQF